MTGETTVVVPGFELYKYRRISDQSMGPYPARVAPWCRFYEPQVGVSTPCGAVSTRGITIFVPSTGRDSFSASEHDRR